MKRCPHCNQPLPEIRAGVRLPPLKARLYDLIARAGPDGITSDDLFFALYDGTRMRTVVKVHVNQINHAMAGTGVRISGAGGRYRLITPITPTASAAA
jgi:hypothetical protein